MLLRILPLAHSPIHFFLPSLSVSALLCARCWAGRWPFTSHPHLSRTSSPAAITTTSPRTTQVCLPLWPFLMVSPVFLTPAEYLTLADAAPTLQMELSIFPQSLRLLILDSLTSITCLSIFLAIGAENQELCLTDSLAAHLVTGCVRRILPAWCSSNTFAPASLLILITTTAIRPARASQLPHFIQAL